MAQALSAEERNAVETTVPGWEAAADGRAITREFRFRDFAEAWGFMSRVALLAEKHDHHPDWSNHGGSVTIRLLMQGATGLSGRHIQFARAIDAIARAAAILIRPPRRRGFWEGEVGTSSADPGSGRMRVRLGCRLAACALWGCWRRSAGRRRSSPSPAARLTIVSTGGAYQDAQRQVYFTPFTTATGIPIHDESWDGGIGTLRTRGENGGHDWDVVQVSGDTLLLGCDEGLFEKLDWGRIGGKDHYLPAGVSDCGVGAIQQATVLAWDRDKFQATPSWADFWDVAKYPGKRGLREGARTNLEIALLADGVAPGDVYKTLRTEDGVERAFRKLDQLKPYVVWWKTPGDAARILASGEVLLTSAPNGVITAAARAQNRHFGIQWTGSLVRDRKLGDRESHPPPRRRLQLPELRRQPPARGPALRPHPLSRPRQRRDRQRAPRPARPLPRHPGQPGQQPQNRRNLLA